jgi:protein tyrosine phosphatase (PTP) superfamily phosphohydrolase (DUF442 family)
MKYVFITIPLSLLWIYAYAAPTDSLRYIRAYQHVSDDLASSGYVMDNQFGLISREGFTHIVSLVPEESSHEELLVRETGMSFTHIPVDWGRPTMKDLDLFVADLTTHRGEKIFVHCLANMRSSAFIFIYRVTQLGVDKVTARDKMNEIWVPVDQWHRFIERGLERYGMDPEYRYEPEFISFLREADIEAAEAELAQLMEAGVDPPFTEMDLLVVAEEYEANNKTGQAARIHKLNALAFPDSWQAQERLGNILLGEGDSTGAIEAFNRVLTLNPDPIWARRMLGCLGLSANRIYWEGIPSDTAEIRKHEGHYDLGDAAFDVEFRNGRLRLMPSWTSKEMNLYEDPSGVFFTREEKWTFEFTRDGMVIFTLPGRTVRGFRSD